MPTLTASDKALSLKLDRARWWALTEQPFYGQLAMGLFDQIDDRPTACTNGKTIRWGREFLAGLSDEQTRFILLHETLHCAHGHLWRLPHDKIGNQAADYCINDTLAAVPGIEMPAEGLTMPTHFRGMAEEEIYAALTSQQQDDGEPSDQQGDEIGSACGDFTVPEEGELGDGDTGDSSPVNGEPGEDGDGAGGAPDSLRDQWDRRVIQAAQSAQALGQGSLPSDMARVLERVRSQPIDWRQEMADFVRDAASSRNDWSRAARRHAWQRVIYPRRKADDLGLIVFARDTSGSISPVLCAEFSALISQCLAETHCRGLVLDCDATIQDEIELSPGDECPLTAKGGGGTDFRPVFERTAELADQGERIAGIVYLTDLDGDFPSETPDAATLWLSTSKKAAPFGRTVEIH